LWNPENNARACAFKVPVLSFGGFDGGTPV
jgi:hypothetical protein